MICAETYLYFFVRKDDETEWHGRCESVSRFNLGAFWQLLYNAVRYEQEARVLGVSIPTNQGPPKKKHDGTACQIMSIYFDSCFASLLRVSHRVTFPSLWCTNPSVEQRLSAQRAFGASWRGEYDTWITWILKPAWATDEAGGKQRCFETILSHQVYTIITSSYPINIYQLYPPVCKDLSTLVEVCMR